MTSRCCYLFLFHNQALHCWGRIICFYKDTGCSFTCYMHSAQIFILYRARWNGLKTLTMHVLSFASSRSAHYHTCQCNQSSLKQPNSGPRFSARTNAAICRRYIVIYLLLLSSQSSCFSLCFNSRNLLHLQRVATSDHTSLLLLMPFWFLTNDYFMFLMQWELTVKSKMVGIMLFLVSFLGTSRYAGYHSMFSIQSVLLTAKPKMERIFHSVSPLRITMLPVITIVLLQIATVGKIGFYVLQFCCSNILGHHFFAAFQYIFYRSRGLSYDIKSIGHFFNANTVKETRLENL